MANGKAMENRFLYTTSLCIKLRIVKIKKVSSQ